MKVIVTGGCGFIGSSVVNSLIRKKCDVVVIDNMSLGKNYWSELKNPRVYNKDILDFDGCMEIFETEKAELVIHLAAHHFIPFCEKNPYEAMNLNIKGTINILEAARKTNVSKLFFASTGDVYPPNFFPHREVDAVSPIYVYGCTKLIGEQVCTKYFENLNAFKTVVIGRLFNAAGPRETNPHLLPEIVKQIKQGKKIIEVGNLWPLRDYVDVESMAEIIVDLCLQVDGIEIVNIGSGHVQTIGDVLNTLKEAAKVDVEIKSVVEKQRPNDRPYLCPDVSRLNRILGRSAEAFSIKTAQAIFKSL